MNLDGRDYFRNTNRIGNPYLYNMNRADEETSPPRDPHRPDDRPVQGPETDERLSRELRRAISSTRQFFFNRQHPDGYWVGELEGDARQESETILLLAFLGEENSELAVACARHLLDTQLEDGGWGRPGGTKSDIDNTVKAYFALKLTGRDPGDGTMQRARIRALELGGADRVEAMTRFHLAILGQVPHGICPVIPPQGVLFPKNFPFHIYAISGPARTVLIPLSIVSAKAPVREIPAEKGIKELFVKAPVHWKTPDVSDRERSGKAFFPNRLFRLSDRVMKACRAIRFTPFRLRAIERAKEWILARFEKSDGPGASFTALAWTWIALKSLGYENGSEEIEYCRGQLDNLVLRDEKRDSARVQPCKSPVRDTTHTLKALLLSGLTAAHPAVRKGVQWVRSRQILEKGDWSETVSVEPGGWCFEFNNAFYPDCDDTATALAALAGRFDQAGTVVPRIASRGKLTLRDDADKSGDDRDETLSGLLPPDLRLLVGENADSAAGAKQSVLELAETTAALERGIRWLLAMQNRDGGWSVFDRDNHRTFLCELPFADRRTMIDPSTPDLTGRVMETLGRFGFRLGQHIPIDRAVSYMKRRQNPDGSWFGHGGANTIFGTWQALTGLAAVGVPVDDPAIAAGANWLLAHQHPSGGWGESPDSRHEASLRGRGNPTASQTAWAVMALIAAGKSDHPSVYRGIRFLLDRKRDDGTWHESEYTGVGFTSSSCLKYHYYSVYFPLMALSLYAAKTKLPNMEVGVSESVLRLHKIRLFSPEQAYYNNTRADDKPERFEEPEPVRKTGPEPDAGNRPDSGGAPKLRIFFG